MATDAEPLREKNVVVCVCGGIAAYKAAYLVRLLVGAGATVRVAMTASAKSFVGELTFQALSGQRVFTDMFDLGQESEIGHIAVADAADLVIVAPATAETIARLAGGRADDVVGAIALATRAPLLLAPSMNVNMWENPITRANVERLGRVVGARTVGPGDGFLACRWTGPGRMAEPDDIVEAAARVLTERDLAGRRVVISAGPTHEPLDPVRYLGNRSSGKMGYALAAAAARRGAAVVLVSGPTWLQAAPGIDARRVLDARSMDAEVQAAAHEADAVIMAAAVADFRPRDVSEQKLKKQDIAGYGEISIELEENPDILRGLGEARAGKQPVLVGFAAETSNVVENAKNKLIAKGCDLVVANDVSASDAGFSVDTNRVVLVDAKETTEVELAGKDVIAHRILDRVVDLLAAADEAAAAAQAAEPEDDAEAEAQPNGKAKAKARAKAKAKAK